MVGGALPQRLEQLVDGGVGQPHHGGRGGQGELEGRRTLASRCAGDKNASPHSEEELPATTSRQLLVLLVPLRGPLSSRVGYPHLLLLETLSWAQYPNPKRDLSQETVHHILRCR